MKLLIVDDHAIVRQGVIRLLGDEYAGSSFGEARTGEQALLAIAAQAWDIVILDVDLPGRSGLDLLKDVRQTHPALPILMFSMHAEEQFAMRALRAGASGYLSKDSPASQLLAAIRSLSRGNKYVSVKLAGMLATELTHSGVGALHEELSHREFEVLRHIAAGRNTSAIAGLLALSPKTVSTYRSRILQKLDLQSNAELVRYAIDQRLDHS